MKYLFILLITFPVFACKIQIPTSEAQRYIDALPNGVVPLWTCADKPEEDCLCVEDVVWEQAEIVTEFSRNDLGINIEKKSIKNSATKKAQKLIERDAKKAKKITAKENIKAFKFKGNTIKELREELNEYIKDSAEVAE